MKLLELNKGDKFKLSRTASSTYTATGDSAAFDDYLTFIQNQPSLSGYDFQDIIEQGATSALPADFNVIKL